MVSSRKALERNFAILALSLLCGVLTVCFVWHFCCKGVFFLVLGVSVWSSGCTATFVGYGLNKPVIVCWACVCAGMSHGSAVESFITTRWVSTLLLHQQGQTRCHHLLSPPPLPTPPRLSKTSTAGWGEGREANKERTSSTGWTATMVSESARTRPNDTCKDMRRFEVSPSRCRTNDSSDPEMCGRSIRWGWKSSCPGNRSA